MKRILYILPLVICMACIDPIEFETEANSAVLVVEGNIGTAKGPYEFKLSNTAIYGDAFDGVLRKVNGAQISIRDNLGNVVVLSEIGNGVYRTPENFTAVVGRSYTLQIGIGERQYLSLPEFVRETPEIDSLVVEYAEKPYIASPGTLGTLTGFKVSVEFDDNSETDDNYLWYTNGVYLLKTRPDLFTVERMPAPKDCCETCYIYEDNQAQFSLEEDQIFNGKKTRQEVAFIVNDGKRYMDRYFLIIHHQNISNEAHAFFEKLIEQRDLTGDIFDAPPASIRGNIYNINNPDEHVIGYFTAADIKRDSIFLLRDQLPFVTQDVLIPDDCRETRNAFTQKPVFWQ